MPLFETVIAANRAKSWLVMLLFVLLYTILIFSIIFCADVFLVEHATPVTVAEIVFVAVASHALAVLLVLALVSGSTGRVLRYCRAEPIPRGQEVQLHNVVEEVALAAGMPAPGVYRMDSPVANALAIGLPDGREVIVVTTGLLERLGRDELQAVVAYQMARIQSGDIGLMTVVAGLAGLTALLWRSIEVCMAYILMAALLVTAVYVVIDTYWDLDATTLDSLKPGQPMTPARILTAILAVPAVCLLMVSPFAGRLIQLCVSRERHFLADAEAARLTRYPEALARALETLAEDDRPLPLAGSAVAHLCIVQPRPRRGRGPRGVWSSHPSIEERVDRLRAIGNIDA